MALRASFTLVAALYIAAADVQRLRRLLLGLCRTAEAVPQPHDLPLPPGQLLHHAAQPGRIGTLLAVCLHVSLIGQGVCQR